MRLFREPEPTRIRCAPFRRGLEADPVGTAGNYDAFVVVESPLPWGRDATQCWPFVELGWSGPFLAGADGRRWRPVVVARGPLGGSVPEDTASTVTVWERPAPGGGPYRSRRWWTTHPEEVPELVRSVVDGTRDGPDPEAPPTLHLCTHGRRDVCCGSMGTSLFDGVQLVDQPAGPVGSGRPVELWRCSHTGGHRFAPTGITFPDGLVWGHLTPVLVCELAERAAWTAEHRPVPPPSPELVAACRGSSSLPEGPAQVADRAAWVRFGWGWVDADRSVTVDGPVPSGPDDPPVRVVLEGPLGGGALLVGVADRVPTPTCGIEGPLGPGGDVPDEPVWRVLDAVWSTGAVAARQ